MTRRKQKPKQQPKPVKPSKKLSTFIKRSRTTGRIVWIYQAPTKEAARQAFHRIRRRENTRVRWWKNRVTRRAKDIQGYLQRLVDALPILGDITQEQRQAIRDIQHLADQPPKCDTGLYNHLRSEYKRRKRDRDFKEKQKSHNHNYDK